MNTFTISRNKLLAALLRCKRVINPRMDFESYTQFMFMVTPDLRLDITTTDGDILMKESLSLDEYDLQEPTMFSLDRRYLLHAIKALDDQPLQFEIMDYQVKVRHSQGSFWLSRGDVSGILPTVADKYAPESLCRNMEPETHSVQLEVPGFRHWLDMCYLSLANDDLRPVMNCMCLDFLGDGLMRIAGSDAYQLTIITRVQKGAEFKGLALLPRKVCAILHASLPRTGMMEFKFQEFHHHKDDQKKEECYRKAMGHVTVHLGGETDPAHVLHIYYVNGGMNDKYPRYMSVVPTSFNYKLVVDRKNLLKTINRMIAFANQRSGQFRLSIKPDQMELSCSDKEMEAGAMETLDCEFTTTDNNSDLYKPELLVGIRGSMVASVLKRLNAEKVEWNFRDPSAASIISPMPQPDVENISVLMMPSLIS